MYINKKNLKEPSSSRPQDLEEQFQLFRAHNESKNIFKAARTPSVFFAIALVFYVASGVLGLVGLYPLANLCNLAMGLALLTLVLWAYIRYALSINSSHLFLRNPSWFLLNKLSWKWPLRLVLRL